MNDENLAEALTRETKRVRDVVIPAYIACGPGGVFALALMRRDLDSAMAAALNGDVVAMLRAHEALKGWSL